MSTLLQLLTPSAEFLGAVALLAGLLPDEVGRDDILGRSRDADDVLHLQQYRLVRPP